MRRETKQCNLARKGGYKKIKTKDPVTKTALLFKREIVIGKSLKGRPLYEAKLFGKRSIVYKKISGKGQ